MKRFPALELIAQTAELGEVAQKLLPWIGLLVGVLVVLVLALRYYRRCLHQADEDADSGWTLDGIRRLRDAGEIDDDEYARLRAGVLAEMGVKLDPSAGSAPQAVDAHKDADNDRRDGEL